MKLILWIIIGAGLLIIIYHHLLYPFLLHYLAVVKQKCRAHLPPASSERIDLRLPSITLLIPAYNEEAFIAAKIRNIAALCYPSDKLNVVIALDGSRDQTAKCAIEAARDPNVGFNLEIVEYVQNIGKITVLNDQIPRIESDIVALSDTSALISSDAMLRAAEHFTDATVGFVASRYLLARPGSEGERAYMLQLARVRSDEAILDSPLGAHGAFYLFRRRLFRPFLQGTINDDFILPMEIVKQGYRGRYDNSIEAVELETTQQKQEFRRRVRIGAGNLQQSLRLWELVNCRRPWVAFMFLSGKGARPFMPLVGLLIFVATALLVAQGSVAATALLAAQATIIGVGLIGIRLRNVRIPKVISWLGYLIEGYSASVLGVIYYASQRRIEWRANASSQISNIKMVTIWPPSDQARPKILK